MLARIGCGRITTASASSKDTGTTIVAVASMTTIGITIMAGATLITTTTAIKQAFFVLRCPWEHQRHGCGARDGRHTTWAGMCVCLGPTAQGAYYQNGSTNFTANCGIYVNSNNPTAAMLGNGGASVSATSINVVGGVNWAGSMTPTPFTDVAPFDDPLKYLQPPSPCDVTTGCDSASCPNNSKPFVVSSDTTLSPGTYCGGIFVKSATATLSAGRYIIVGGGIGTQDTNSVIVGSNVFIYNTYDKHNGFSPINFNANSSVLLSAPNDDPPYSGILYFEDRQCCTTMQTDSFQGGATSYFQGTVYAPSSLVKFAGNPAVGVTSSTAKYTVVIARQFSVQGPSNMSNDVSNVTGGNPIKVVALVE
jgi:hypothetical protein